MLLTRGLEKNREVSDRPAIVDSNRQWSYGELLDESGALATAMVAAGVAPGDRVAVLCDPRGEPIALSWAAFRAGGSIVHLNPQVSQELLTEVVDDCEPRLIFANRKLAAEKLVELRDRYRVILIDEPEYQEFLASATSRDAVQVEDGALAAIVYTSGSTGKPKGVCLSHRNLMTVMDTVIAQTPVGRDDSYLMVVPLHYVHGLMQLLVHGLAGACIHMAKGFLFPNAVVKQLEEQQVTGFSGVPYHFNALVERSRFLDAELPHLRWVTVTGGKAPAETMRRIQESRPDLRIFIAYGQTECAPRATLLDPSRILAKMDSVGAPIPGVRVLLLDAAGEEVAAGEMGEVVVAGDNVMLGYWGQPEATAEVVDPEGRLHTGDLGRFDDEGDLFLVGRANDMIKCSGERIFACEIEQVLDAHPEVVEAVALGVPDPLYGERVEAHVRLGRELDDLDEAVGSLRKHCLGSLPFVRAPRQYHIWSDFPRTANGKVDRGLLLEAAGEGHLGSGQ